MITAIIVALAAAFLTMVLITVGILASGYRANGGLRFLIFLASFILALFVLGVLG